MLAMAWHDNVLELDLDQTSMAGEFATVTYELAKASARAGEIGVLVRIHRLAHDDVQALVGDLLSQIGAHARRVAIAAEHVDGLNLQDLQASICASCSVRIFDITRDASQAKRWLRQQSEEVVNKVDRAGMDSFPASDPPGFGSFSV